MAEHSHQAALPRVVIVDPIDSSLHSVCRTTAAINRNPATGEDKAKTWVAGIAMHARTARQFPSGHPIVDVLAIVVALIDILAQRTFVAPTDHRAVLCIFENTLTCYVM